ncbi:MAG: ABC transporter ATP-binding protein [Candidatus Hodarchaeales archaeon]|jgi:putative ABC transport system ATP-binding protein
MHNSNTSWHEKKEKSIMKSPLLEIEHLKKDFINRGQVISVLKDISLEIFRNEIVVIMGPSGAGKTTLLNMLAGLEPITSGNISINGIKIDKMSDQELSQVRQSTIGLVFQEFYLLPHLTAYENTEIPLIFKNIPEDERKTSINLALDRVGMREKEHHYPSELSGGEKQRNAIARAIVNEPSILFVDEPTGNLDSVTGNEIISLFRQLVDSESLSSILMVTHDPEAAQRADRIYILGQGELKSYSEEKN